MSQRTYELNRRVLLWAPILLGANFLSEAGRAGPLDSIPLGRSAKVVQEASAIISQKTSNKPGVISADVASPGRAWLSVDFALTDKTNLTLMIWTEDQKAQFSSGVRPAGDPLARVAIRGPETANHTVSVHQGNYFVAFLNDSARKAALSYRISLQTY